MQRIRRHGHPRRSILPLMVVWVLTSMLSACTSRVTGSAQPAAFVPPFIGTLQTIPANARTESDNGIKVAMLELDWADYEPTDGHFAVKYEDRMKAEMSALTAAGMRVTLGLGLHFTPAWVSELPNSRFVDQDGKVSSAVDMTFNSVVRSAVERYVDRVNQSFGLHNFWAVRISAGGSGELVYPGGGTYWAFGRNPQNGPQYPSTLAPNPHPGWRPGDTNLKPAQVRAWYDWYVAALVDTAKWQLGLLSGLGFAGYYQILTPGVGVLPAALERAIDAHLPNGVAGRGAAWDAVYRGLPHNPTTVAYVTSVADGSGGDAGCRPLDDMVPLSSASTSGWSATRWISRIADEFKMTKAGENPGYEPSAPWAPKYADPSTTGMMATSIEQARSCQFQGVYWAHDAQLWNDTIDIKRLFAHTTPKAGLPLAATG